MTTTLGATFTTTMRMIDRVHRRSTNVRTTTHPALATCFTQHDATVIAIASRANSCPTGRRNTANFAAGQRNLSPIRLASHQRGMRAGTATQHATATLSQLDIMDLGPQGNLGQRQAIAQLGRRLGTTQHIVALLQPIRSNDVSLLAIGVMQQGNACRAIGIVLDRIDLGRDSIFVATEINQAIPLLVTTTTMASRDFALVIATTLFGLRAQQALLRLGTGVSSAKSLTDAPRRPGVVGLYFRIPIVDSCEGLACEWHSHQKLATRA